MNILSLERDGKKVSSLVYDLENLKDRDLAASFVCELIEMLDEKVSAPDA